MSKNMYPVVSWTHQQPIKFGENDIWFGENYIWFGENEGE